jgi:hypothetical protein
MICTPIIISAIDSNISMNTAPRKGDIIIIIENPIAIAPATMPNTLDALPLVLSPIPRINLAIPSNHSATSSKTNKNTPVATGNVITKIDNIRTSTPRPTLPQREPLGLGVKIPDKILSIPTKNKAMASISTIVMKVRPG